MTRRIERLPGNDDRPERPALAEAIYMARNAERRAPTPADAPPVSTFLMTKAARAALRLSRGLDRA